MSEILRKLRNHSPEWYDLYVQRFDEAFRLHYASLLTAPPDKVLRQQGVVATYDSHLQLLKQNQ